ncbi:putative ribonuclease H-like domain-containing protein [Tanacetum coccineum]
MLTVDDARHMDKGTMVQKKVLVQVILARRQDLAKTAFLMPLWKDGSLFDSSSKNASNGEPQPYSDAGKKDDEGVCKDNEIDDQERPENSTQDVNTVGPSINTERLFSFRRYMLTLESHHADFCLVLMDLPLREEGYGTKWIFRNKKDERVIVIQNKARLVAQGHTQEEGIDYDEVFSPEVYVCQPPGFEDPDYPDKVYKVVKALYGLHQALRAWKKPLLKDSDGDDVDVHLYSPMIGSLMQPNWAFGILELLTLTWWHILIVTMLEQAWIGSYNRRLSVPRVQINIMAEARANLVAIPLLK